MNIERLSRPRAELLLLTLALCALVTACGFHPRGRASLPFGTLYVAAPENSAVATELRRAIASGSQTELARVPEKADAILRIIGESRDKQILSLSAEGRVREFQLRYRVSYTIEGPNKQVIVPPSDIVLNRDFLFNDAQVLAKEAEEALLFRDMQSDAVNQLMRRLAALKPSA